MEGVSLAMSPVQTVTCRDIELLDKCPDPLMKTVAAKVRRAAPLQSSVLILGESGCGKELVAHAIHGLSDCRSHEIINFNCANINRELMASELFGHVKGAFTGALGDHMGYVARAHESSLFLDEIGELRPEVQGRLLQVLETRKYNLVGSTKTAESRFRLLAATNRNLETEVKENRFKNDLFQRLNVISIRVPPLRDRRLDIDYLANFFLKKHAKGGARFSPEARQKLAGYDWPGNVRELEHVVERAMLEIPVLEAGVVHDILPEHVIFRDGYSPSESPAQANYNNARDRFVAEMFAKGAPVDMRAVLDEVEICMIVIALQKANGHQGNAAEMLSIPRTTLQSKIKLYLPSDNAPLPPVSFAQPARSMESNREDEIDEPENEV